MLSLCIIYKHTADISSVRTDEQVLVDLPVAWSPYTYYYYRTDDDDDDDDDDVDGDELTAVAEPSHTELPDD